MSRQSQSLTLQFVCLLLLALQLDNHPDPGKKLEVSPAAPGSAFSLSLPICFLEFYLVFSRTCLFFQLVLISLQFLFNLCCASLVNTVVLLTLTLQPPGSFLVLTASQSLWLKTSPLQFFFLFTLALSLSHCPPSLSLRATVFTWPLHVT